MSGERKLENNESYLEEHLEEERRHYYDSVKRVEPGVLYRVVVTRPEGVQCKRNFNTEASLRRGKGGVTRFFGSGSRNIGINSTYR